MISELRPINRVTRQHAEHRAARYSVASDREAVAVDRQAAEVELHVMIWAKAQHIADDIVAVAGPTQRANMGALAVEARARLDAATANLAASGRTGL
jgi:hypothetical protein